MKRVDSKTVVATIATVLIAASSPSVSFAKSDNSSATGLFQISDLDFTEVRRDPQCCELCEDQQARSTMTFSGGGSLGRGKYASAESFPQTDKNNDNDHEVIRILTWAGSKKELQAHAALYKMSHPEAPTIRVVDVPSLKELDYEVTSELRLGSTLYDGFVAPPLLMGNMLRPRSGKALSIWTEEDIEEFDLLPYYRYNVATYGGRLRGLPILSGSQGLILFRKDYLDTLNLPTPKTWEDWTTIASTFSDQNDHLIEVWPDNNHDSIYGACLGLLNEAGCRRRNSLGGSLCKSQTMTYLGMIMASMTQYAGNSTGYMLGILKSSPNGLEPLFEPTLERTLKWMEKQVENSSPLSLKEDSIESMKNFREGRCAWTISVDHDDDFLTDDNIGFVPIPGSHQVLDRSAPAGIESSQIGAPDSMVNCTEEFCPHGKEFLNAERVNQVPFGAVDATIGIVSALIPFDRQEKVKKFFKFVLATDTYHEDSIQQPLTYSKLKKSRIPNYEATIKSLTSSANAAIPIRVPNAFNLLSDLDDRIFDYLAGGEYSDDKREEVTRAAEKSWNAMISMYDFRRPHNKQPTSMFYELSMGQHAPPPAPDLYIGWVARGVMWTLAGLSCLGSVFAALWVWTYQQERVIRGMFIL